MLEGHLPMPPTTWSDMKFQIDKFLTLTAMMATAQLGVLACTTDPEDGTDESGEDAGADDDQGSSDDDAADDDSADDDAAACREPARDWESGHTRKLERLGPRHR